MATQGQGTQPTDKEYTAKLSGQRVGVIRRPVDRNTRAANDNTPEDAVLAQSRNTQKKKRKKGALGKSAKIARLFAVRSVGMWIILAAIFIDILQLGFNLLYLGIAELTETTLIGTVISAIDTFSDFLFGFEIEDAVLLFWAFTAFLGIAGMFLFGFLLSAFGVRIFGGKHASAKAVLLLLVFVADIWLFPINGFFPGLTIWTVFLIVFPE